MPDPSRSPCRVTMELVEKVAEAYYTVATALKAYDKLMAELREALKREKKGEADAD